MYTFFLTLSLTSILLLGEIHLLLDKIYVNTTHCK